MEKFIKDEANGNILSSAGSLFYVYIFMKQKVDDDLSVCVLNLQVA